MYTRLFLQVILLHYLAFNGQAILVNVRAHNALNEPIVNLTVECFILKEQTPGITNYISLVGTTDTRGIVSLKSDIEGTLALIRLTASNMNIVQQNVILTSRGHYDCTLTVVHSFTLNDILYPNLKTFSSGTNHLFSIFRTFVEIDELGWAKEGGAVPEWADLFIAASLMERRPLATQVMRSLIEKIPASKGEIERAVKLRAYRTLSLISPIEAREVWEQHFRKHERQYGDLNTYPFGTMLPLLPSKDMNDFYEQLKTHKGTQFISPEYVEGLIVLALHKGSNYVQVAADYGVDIRRNKVLLDAFSNVADDQVTVDSMQIVRSTIDKCVLRHALINCQYYNREGLGPFLEVHLHINNQATYELVMCFERIADQDCLMNILVKRVTYR